MLRLDKVNKYYQVGTHSLHVLRDVDFEVADGEFVAIMGASGSGKSTLLNILGILDDYDAGEYWLGDTLDQRPVRDARRPTTAIASSASSSSRSTCCRSRPRSRTSRCRSITRASRAGSATRSRCSTSSASGCATGPTTCRREMSGGQKQRVAIARALIGKPRLILADEPTGALDSETSRQIMDLMSEINQTGITVLVVTHDPEVAARTQRTIRLRDGKVVDAHEASSNPAWQRADADRQAGR